MWRLPNEMTPEWFGSNRNEPEWSCIQLNIARASVSRNHRLVTWHLSFPSCPVSRIPWNYIQLIYPSFSGLSSKAKNFSLQTSNSSKQPSLTATNVAVFGTWLGGFFRTTFTYFVTSGSSCKALSTTLKSSTHRVAQNLKGNVEHPVSIENSALRAGESWKSEYKPLACFTRDHIWCNVHAFICLCAWFLDSLCLLSLTKLFFFSLRIMLDKATDPPLPQNNVRQSNGPTLPSE